MLIRSLQCLATAIPSVGQVLLLPTKTPVLAGAPAVVHDDQRHELQSANDEKGYIFIHESRLNLVGIQNNMGIKECLPHSQLTGNARGVVPHLS